MIEIKNLRDEKPHESWDFKVDRTTKLGNPFKMIGESEMERNRVCDFYETNFEKNVSMADLEHLILAYKKYGKLRLFCWCTPKRCHAETIKRYIEAL